jgi:hypothetical protein
MATFERIVSLRVRYKIAESLSEEEKKAVLVAINGHYKRRLERMAQAVNEKEEFNPQARGFVLGTGDRGTEGKGILWEVQIFEE